MTWWARFWRHLSGSSASPYPTSALPPERTRESVPVGACGVRGCPNDRPHSHATGLARRLRDRRIT